MSRHGRDYDAYFRACYLPVARTVFLIVHDRALAEDVAQEAFYRLLTHWRAVTTYDVPEAWVRRVAVRIAIHEIQRAAARARPGATVRCDDLPDPDLARAVATLSSVQRAVVVLFYWEDRPVAEIAEILEVSETTATQHLCRASRRLSELLAEEAVTGDAR